MSEVMNLDRVAALHAQNLIKEAISKGVDNKIENTVTKALGVLQENGMYACFLYLLAAQKRNQEKVTSQIIVTEMLALLGDGENALKFGWGEPKSHTPQNILSYITDNVTVNLEKLLLAKETLEQMLIYARYGAKARVAEVKENQTNNDKEEKNQEETP